jgi:hypothetical protein
VPPPEPAFADKQTSRIELLNSADPIPLVEIMFNHENENGDEDETGGKANSQQRQRVSAAQPAIYWSFCARRCERNSDQKEPTSPAPFKIVCHHEGFSATGVDALCRQDTRPATNDAAADAMELMLLAWLVSE